MAAGASSSAAARQRWELENNVQRDEQVALHDDGSMMLGIRHPMQTMLLSRSGCYCNLLGCLTRSGASNVHPITLPLSYSQEWRIVVCCRQTPTTSTIRQSCRRCSSSGPGAKTQHTSRSALAGCLFTGLHVHS